MSAVFGSAEAGQAQLVLIEAEPGMGKSALLDNFLTTVDAGHVLRLRCDEFEADLAFGAVGMLLDEPMPAGSEVEAGRRLLARLSDIQDSGAGVTVLAIDDAQWLDRPSAQALRFALRRLRADRVLSVIARRPAPAHHDPSGIVEADVTTVVRPAPLSADSVRQLAWQLRAWNLSQAAAERLAHRTGGVPLLLGAVLRGAADMGHLESGAEVTSTAAAAASRLLESVPRPTRRLVQASSVFAEPAEVLVLGRLARVEDPFAAVGAGVTAGLLKTGPNDVVGCSHDLLREAVYSAIPLDVRRKLHERAARWTTGERRLAHRASASERPDPSLTTELVRAADVARAGLRYDLAATQRLRARSVSDDPAQRDDLLLEALIDRAAAQDLVGAAELAELADGLSPSALRSLALGLLARDSGRVGEARFLLQDAVSRARSNGDRATLRRAQLAAAVFYVRITEGQAAVDVIGDADRASDPELAGDARATKGIGLWETGDVARALALLDSAQLSRGGTAWEADLLGVRGMIRLFAGQLPQALSDFDHAVAMTHLWRPSTNQSRIYVMRSVARFELGDWDGAAVDAGAARALSEGGSEAWSIPLARAVAVDVLLGRGQWTAAADHLDVAKAALAHLAPIQGADLVASRETALLLARQDFTGAVALLQPLQKEEYLTRVAPYRSHRWVVPAWVTACVQLGRLVEAEDALRRYEVMLDRWPGGPTPSRLAWLRGLIAESRGEPRLAQGHYADELTDPQALGVPYAHAQALYAAGRLERALGQRRRAVEHLAQAQVIFARLRAVPFLQRCVAELNACGMQATMTSPLTLTEREEDVAALVARGYSNKEVAAELFVTAKGVEFHLSNIYRKLGVSSRQELRRLRAVS